MILSTMAACSGSGGGGPGAMNQAVIGAAGGQVTSADGRLTLTIPAGALAGPETISVTKVGNAMLDPQLAAGNPFCAYRFEPDGLQFQMPVSVSLDLEPPLTNTSGVIETRMYVPIVASGTQLQFLDGFGLQADAARNMVTVQGTMVHFSDFVVYRDDALTNARYRLQFPAQLGATETGTLTGTITQSMAATESSTQIRWQSEAFSQLTTSIDNLTVFDAMGLQQNQAQTLTNTATVTCFQTGNSRLVVNFELSALLIPLLFLAPMPTIMQADVTFFGDVDCLPPMPTGGPTLVQTQGISSIEALRVVAPLGACGPAASILVAGLDGANFIDPLARVVTRSLTVPSTGPFFDALYFPDQGAAGDAGLFLSGIGLRMDRVDANCDRGVFAQVSSNNHLDAAYAAGDPALGAHAAGPGIITEIIFSPASQGWVFQDSGIPNSVLPVGFRSVQGNAAGDKFLALGAFELSFVDASGAVPTGISAFPLGQNPRRVRWDPSSGIGAISDLTDDTITIFSWDGQNTPVLTDVVSVGSGPVGLDIMGSLICCAGFNDDTYTVITVDASGMATNVDISPSPFGTSAQAPGHAVFLGDANNTIVISYNASGVVGLIPNAY
ncbi:MAG: hypothetical protein KDB53_06560 [Planctomycetes bacterium]|nr:hypothetical protein [Planctomycetota bacterium]